MKEFTSKSWSKSSLDRLISKIVAGLPFDRIIGPCRHKSVRTIANITHVDELICSQENAPGTRTSPSLSQKCAPQQSGCKCSRLRHIGRSESTTIVVMLRLSNRRSKSIFFENRIELKSIFWLAFFRFWLTAILAKTTHCFELGFEVLFKLP